MAFTYYSPIVIDHTKVPSTQSSFPVLVDITDNRLKSSVHVSSSSGFDIRPYVDSAGTTAITDFELQSYNSSTGRVVMWVLVSSVSSSADTTFYLFYGNSSLTTDGSVATTWDTNYTSVYHFEDNAANTNAHQSTANSNTGTLQANSSTKTTTGKIVNGLTFNGSSDFMTFGDTTKVGIANSSTGYTFSAWINTSNTGGNNTVFGGRDNGAGNPIIDIAVGFNALDSAPHKMGYIMRDNPGNTATHFVGTVTVDDGAWHYIVLTRTTGGVWTGYTDGAVDGGPSAADSFTGGVTIPNAEIGNETANGSYSKFNGTLDEIRFSKIARSADWITTEYHNQNSPSTFITLGTEVAVGGSPPTLSSITPSSGYANPTTTVTFTGVALVGTALDAASPVVNVPTGWSAGGYSASDSAHATFNLTVKINETPGNYNISVSTVNGGPSGTVTFTVSNPAAGGGGVLSQNMNGGFVN